jgi:hypothetical protein
MDSPDLPRAFEEEATHAMPWDPVEIVFATPERKESQLKQSFSATLKVMAQSEETLTVLAKGLQPHDDRPAVRPEKLVSLEGYGSIVSVP